MTWIYKGKEINITQNLPKDSRNAYGFIYKISYIGDTKEGITKGKFYIGKKALSFSKKKRLTIKEKKEPENKRKRFKIDVRESDWRDYQGSSLNLQKDIAIYGEENFTKIILFFCEDKINLTYKEMELQFQYDVLRTDSWNISIGGKFFKGKIK